MDDFDQEFDDDDYMYMEDTYIAADDLAEHAIASPVPFEGDEEFDPDHWRYDYWMDIEYDSHGDAIRARQAGSRQRQERKRKRTASSEKSSTKRRKIVSGIGGAPEQSPAVLLVDKRIKETMSSPISKTDFKSLKPWALLKDWRILLETASVFPATNASTTLAHVVDAVEDEEVILSEDSERGLEEELEGDEDGEGFSNLLMPDGIDPEVLKMSLRHKMEEAGLTGMDEETLMRFLGRMAGNEGKADEIAGELADELLVQREDDEGAIENTQLSQWVSKQARTSATESQPVSPLEENSQSLRAEATATGQQVPTPTSTVTTGLVENEDTETITQPTPTAMPRTRKRKAIGVDDIHASKRVIRAHSPLKNAPSTTQGNKRKADTEIETQQSKRPVQSYDAATAASKSRSLSVSAPPAKPVRRARKG